jgi:serine/threonine protein kinase
VALGGLLENAKLDWGRLKLMESIHKSRLLAGTIGYLSPEQLQLINDRNQESSMYKIEIERSKKNNDKFGMGAVPYPLLAVSERLRATINLADEKKTKRLETK